MTSVRGASFEIPSTVLWQAGVLLVAAPGCVPADELTERSRNSEAVPALSGVGVVRCLGERGAVHPFSEIAKISVNLAAGMSVAIARRAIPPQPRIEVEGSAHRQAVDARLDRAPRTAPEGGAVPPAIHRGRVRGSKPVLGVEHDH